MDNPETTSGTVDIPRMFENGKRTQADPLQPDECVRLMDDICPAIWDEDGPTVKLMSDQWFMAILGCHHGKWRGPSQGWEKDAIAVAFTAALYRMATDHEGVQS